jgi:hypothetical protein
VDLARASSRALLSMLGAEGLGRAAPAVAEEIAELTRSAPRN